MPPISDNAATMNKRIQQHFYDSAALKTQCATTLSPLLQIASDMIFAAISNGNKILACGNGGSAADAQHFAAEMIGRFERDRPGLPAIALTTDSSILTAVANDYHFNEIFSRQIQTLGVAGDVLLAISTSGNSANILAAIQAAKEREMMIIVLSGKGGGAMNDHLDELDVHSECGGR